MILNYDTLRIYFIYRISYVYTDSPKSHLMSSSALKQGPDSTMLISSFSTISDGLASNSSGRSADMGENVYVSNV